MLDNLTNKLFLKWLEIFDIVGEWWKQEILAIYDETVATGGTPNVSDAFTINGQPGDLYPCSKPSQKLPKLILVV